MPRGCWELNLKAPEELPVLLTTEATLQPLNVILKYVRNRRLAWTYENPVSKKKLLKKKSAFEKLPAIAQWIVFQYSLPKAPGSILHLLNQDSGTQATAVVKSVRLRVQGDPQPQPVSGLPRVHESLP